MNKARLGARLLALYLAAQGASVWAEEAHHQGGVATARSGQLLGEPWKDEAAGWRWRSFASYLESRSSFDADGHRRALPNNGRFTSWSLNFFGERSLGTRWSASAFLPVQASRLKDDLGHSGWYSLGDVYGWARYRLDEFKGMRRALSAGIKAPGTYRTVSGVGDGQVDVELQGFLAKTFAERHYVALNSGFRFRTGSPSNEIPYGLQAGWAPSERLLLVPAVSGVRGIGGGVQKDFLGAGLSGFWTLSGPWRLFGSYQKIVMGKNTAAADIGSVGVSYR